MTEVTSTRQSIENPYPGLRPFREDEAHLFFGREKHTRQLREQLTRNDFLAVVGVSGSGKSSLVRAGLLASLRTDGDGVTAQRWRIAELRPGGDPLLHLARALARTLRPERQALFRHFPAKSIDAAIEGDQAFILTTLQRGPLGLLELLKETRLPDGDRLLVFVDQFEEIFRFRQEDGAETNGQRSRQARIDASEAFVALLLETAKQAKGVAVLLTMRSDYLGDCAVFPGLPEAIDSSQYLTPRLTRQQRAAAIVAPARVCGGDIDPALTNRLLNEAGPESDQLPLLQHCLMRMWTLARERMKGAQDQPITLRIADYESTEVGTLKKCLSNHGNGVLAHLASETLKRLAELLFRALATQTAGRRDIRREVTLGHVLSLAVRSEESAPALLKNLTQVINAFRAPGCSFIVTSEDQAQLGPETCLDISHEALIRNWDTLRGWVEAETESVDMYRWVEQTARCWKEGKAALWSTPSLEFAMEWKQREHLSAKWAARYGGDFLLAMEFLNQSQAQKAACDQQREAERVEKEQALREEAERERLRATQEQKRAEREKKLRRRERWYAVTCILVSLAAAIVIAWRYLEFRETKKRLAERSRDFYWRAEDVNQSTDPLKDSKELWNLSVALRYNIHNVKAARWACELLYRHNWCVPLTASLHHASTSGAAVLCAATFSPKGSQAKIFAVSEDGELLVSRPGRPALVRRESLFTVDQPGGTGPAPAAAFFSDDGRLLLVIPPGSITPPSPGSAPGPADSSDPDELVDADLWQWSPTLDSYERIQPHLSLNGRNSFRTVTWNSDCSVLALTSYSSGWGKSYCQVFKRQGSSYTLVPDVSARLTDKKVVSLCFDFHNRWLATASYDGTKGSLEFLDPVNFAPVRPVPGAGAVFQLDGRPAAIGSGPGKDELTVTMTGRPVQRWNLTMGKPTRSFPQTGRDLYPARVVFGPERSGQRLEGIGLFRRMMVRDNARTKRPEPICFRGTAATAKFSDDGEEVMTLSGDNSNALDTIRIWSAPASDPPADADQYPFSGRSAPSWLADLAEWVSGLETPYSNGATTYPKSSQIPGFVAKEPQSEYAKIWQRFEPILNRN